MSNTWLAGLAGADLTRLGRLAPRPAAELGSSRFSVGCETLDRGMWQFPKVLPHLQRLGAKWARVQTGWGKCETTPGEYDFAWLDAIVDPLLAAGIEPWFNVGYGNKLYTPDAPHPTAVGWTPVKEPAARAGWAAFATALARHFAGRVNYYEVWNEPDIKAFWTPYEPSADSYADLVALTAPALRAGDPRAKVVAGAIAGAFSDHGLAYVQRLFECGLGEHLDVFSYHLYVPTPEGWYEQRQPLLRDLVHRHRPGLPLWQGESGAPSVGQPGQALANYEWDEAKQAKWDARRSLLDVLLGADRSAFFHAADFEFYIVKDQIVPKTYYFGLIGGEDHHPKPAYFAAQSICTLLAGDIAVADSAAKLVPDDADRADRARAHTFATPRGPLVACWEAADLMQPYTPSQGRLETAVDWREPVLIDPVGQDVYALPAGRAWRVPVVDWPLFVTEKAAVPLA